jgi:hypothetical protein
VTEPQHFSAGHSVCFTDKMPISSAYSYEHMDEAYYDVIALRTKHPGEVARGAVIVQRLPVGTDTAYYGGEHFSALMELPGVTSGFFAQGAAHQMFHILPESQYVTIVRTDDLKATLDAWEKLDRRSASKAAKGIAIDTFEPLTPRLTSIQVAEANAEEQERERRARTALGDRLHCGPPPQGKPVFMKE